jgi:hypothetical protein
MNAIKHGNELPAPSLSLSIYAYDPATSEGLEKHNLM